MIRLNHMRRSEKMPLYGAGSVSSIVLTVWAEETIEIQFFSLLPDRTTLISYSINKSFFLWIEGKVTLISFLSLL